MVWNKKIFCASNPAKLLDALWETVQGDKDALHDLIIFLPSRRAVRSVERMLVDKCGHAILLPKLVPLGEGPDDAGEEQIEQSENIISNSERVVILAKLLTADPNVKSFSSALPIASDLVRMQDYIENEKLENSNEKIDWPSLVDERYAKHFQNKAKFLELVTNVLPTLYAGQITQSEKRNNDIREWVNQLSNYKKVIVCGSTASVPATADLMVHIAGMDNGYVILPGKIAGRTEDFKNDANPYNSEYKFLERIGLTHLDVGVIDVGPSDIDFFNFAFSNSGGSTPTTSNAKLIECNRESEEADAVAEIASRAIASNKTVLVITPDAAGNQRIAAALMRRGLTADFSGGKNGAMTLAGRAILNLLDDWTEEKDSTFDELYKNNNHNLFETLINIVEDMSDKLSPQFQMDSDETIAVWDALQQLSDILTKNGIVLSMADVRSVIAFNLAGVSIRPPMIDDTKIAVLGTIESRMQTADVVILTGLNEGMFPSIGYENAWLPRQMSATIGLPSPNRKVSLMALDFMNLSCGGEVYWTRSRTAGSSQTTESRFLSRVAVAAKGSEQQKAESENILSVVRARDDVPYMPLDYSAPRVPADRTDIYVTELELLIHNPYAFYVRHILRLYPRDDYWKEPDARDFGNLVHNVIEESEKRKTKSENELVKMMDAAAREILPPDSVIFHFWHKRFAEIAPLAEQVLKITDDAGIEVAGAINVAGRIVRARADRVWDGVVLDIKTGAAPSKKQMLDGNMPQLPLEAYMLQQGGFAAEWKSKSGNRKDVKIQFLQLQNNNVKLIEYDVDTTQKMIDASLDKISQLFGRYSKDGEPYEYYETSDPKYRAYDDLARVDD